MGDCPYTVKRFKGTDEEIEKQWLENRKHGVGGSDAATILGLNQYKSPLALWLEKTGKVDAPDLSDNEKVHWGQVLEHDVAAEFASKHPNVTVENRRQTYVSKARPWAYANIDRIIIDGDKRGILEIKTADKMRGGDWEEGVPDYYLPQALHYLIVTGFQFATYAVLIGGNHYVEYEVEYDAEDAKALIIREDEFWDMVKNEQMPELVGAADEGNSLLGYYGANDDTGYLPEDDTTLKLIEDYKTACEALKVAEDIKKQRANKLKDIIGQDKAKENALYKVSWVKSNRRRLNTKRLEAEQPKLYADYCDTAITDGGIRIKEKN